MTDQKLLVMEKLTIFSFIVFAFRLRIHDTCSVHSLHAIPGILGGKAKIYEKPLHYLLSSTNELGIVVAKENKLRSDFPFDYP